MTAITVTTAGARSRLAQATVTPKRLVVLLGWVVVILAALAGAVGLFAGSGPGSTTVTSLRAQPTDLYGTGLYRFDSVLVRVGNRGTDAVTLFLEVPALAAAVVAYRRRSLRGTVALVGILGWM